MDEPHSGAQRPDLDHLAAKVKAGEPGAMLELWEAVKNFVALKAKQRAIPSAHWTTFDDLMQSGFLAVVDTAEKYEPGHGYGFLTALGYHLQTEFAIENGVKSSKRDMLKYAISTENPEYGDDVDSPTIADTLADESAALAFIGVEYADFLTYCHGVIDTAMEGLTASQADVIRLQYYRGLSMREIADRWDVSKQTVSNTTYAALCKLERGRYRRELHECLEAFDDYNQYGYAAQASGVNRFRRSGMSSTEAAALVKTGRR